MMNKKILSRILIFAILIVSLGYLWHYESSKNNVDVETEVKVGTQDDISSNQKESKPSYTELTTYTFRTSYLRKDHYKKHGKSMGFKSAEDYEKAANDVINSDKALIKEEKEDGDYVYYIVDTNEIVFLSKDGYIRTYFNPDGGKSYFDRQ